MSKKAYFGLKAKDEEIAELKNEIKQLKSVMKEVRQDLILRADLKGAEFVNLSCSQWIALCEAVGEKL